MASITNRSLLLIKRYGCCIVFLLGTLGQAGIFYRLIVCWDCFSSSTTPTTTSYVDGDAFVWLPPPTAKATTTTHTRKGTINFTMTKGEKLQQPSAILLDNKLEQRQRASSNTIRPDDPTASFASSRMTSNTTLWDNDFTTAATENRMTIVTSSSNTNSSTTTTSTSSLRHQLPTENVVVDIVTTTIPFPVFVASLPKSGTTSIHAYFQCGNVRSVHYYCPRQVRLGALMQRNIQQRRQQQQQQQRNTTANSSHSSSTSATTTRTTTRIFDGCGGGPSPPTTKSTEMMPQQQQGGGGNGNVQDPSFLGPVHVFTDAGYVLPGGPCYYPSISSLEDMYESYPNMTIVLGIRNSTQWAKSIMAWGNGSLIRRWKRYCSFFINFMKEHYIQQQEQQQEQQEKQERTVLTTTTTTSIEYNDTHRDGGNSSGNDTTTLMMALLLLQDFYEWHNDHIRQFVRHHPSMTYIEFVLDSPLAGHELEQSTHISATCWKHTKPMDTHVYNKQIRRQQQQLLLQQQNASTLLSSAVGI